MSDISQTELFEANNDSLQKDLHVQLPAKIVSFDALSQTAVIELQIAQMDYNGNMLDLPPLVDVPVQMFAWGNFFITAEPKRGDEGVAHFAERCIDGWWESGNKSVPLDVRFHDLSDAFFAGGYRSKPNALTIIPNCLNMGSESASIRIFNNGIIEINGTMLNINCPVTMKQGFKSIGTSESTGDFKTDGDLVANGKSFLDHTNNGYPID